MSPLLKQYSLTPNYLYNKIFKSFSLAFSVFYNLPSSYHLLCSKFIFRQSLVGSPYLNQWHITTRFQSLRLSLQLPSYWFILTASFKTHFKYALFQEAFSDSFTGSVMFCARTDFKASWSSSTILLYLIPLPASPISRLQPLWSTFSSLNTTSLFPTQRLCGPYSLCQKSLSPDLCMAESFFSFRIQLKVAPLVMPSTIRQTPIEEQSESQLTWALQKCQCHERKIKAGTSLH